MSTSANIVDEFRQLASPERSERMSYILSEFQERISKTNRLVLDRVLDMIEATDGDESLHLDMLSSHMSRCDPTHMEYFPWKNGYALFDGTYINSMDDYRYWYSTQDGLWSHPNTPDGLLDREHEKALQQFLERLQLAVEDNADETWFGDTSTFWELPAEYCELLRHVRAIGYENWDKQMFVPDINGVDLNNVENLALTPEELSDLTCTDGFDIAAGWTVGDNENGSCIFYILSRHTDQEEPWRWRIFVEANFPTNKIFDTLEEFLSWLSSADDWIDWEGVETSIAELHILCSSHGAQQQQASDQLINQPGGLGPMDSPQAYMSPGSSILAN